MESVGDELLPTRFCEFVLRDKALRVLLSWIFLPSEMRGQ